MQQALASGKKDKKKRRRRKKKKPAAAKGSGLQDLIDTAVELQGIMDEGNAGKRSASDAGLHDDKDNVSVSSYETISGSEEEEDGIPFDDDANKFDY